jgi:hypothetical protein
VAAAGSGPGVLHLAELGPGEMLVAAVVFGTMGTVLYPLARALARRLEGRTGAAVPSLHAVEERLDRIERSVEAVAVEVERISEGQRFVTKLLAERAATQLPPGHS